ncbi:coiled-coil domain-containing protein 42 homolog [Periophthalmus magnuspinnatus]|uniref:coiled-coil domain-containing protein 42 homolog n=1 Tax=Periophthalmus magnuspinnatus TaxID=409849 RepID=UPI00145B6CDC|nr:coiled-coil domain-containing protein 42 homolog [Periophthalmus magnuspinnatus]
MCNNDNHLWPKSASGWSTGGSVAIFENGIFDWSNSFFEMKNMCQDEEKLTSKCDERKKTLESIKSRKEVIHREMAHLKKQHLSHNVFLKSKDTEQMLKKAECKMKEVQLMETVRQTLAQELVQLQQKKSELELQVQSHSVFHDFLEQVVKLSKFKEVWEQVDHFESLLHCRDQLSQRDNNDQDRINKLRSELVTLQDQSHLMMVHRRNQLSHLQTELEKTRSEAFKWEQKWNHIEETAAKKTLLLGKIKMAILNLYEMTGSPLDNGGNGVDENDTNTQLEKIQEFILDHNDIVDQNLSTKEQDMPDNSNKTDQSSLQQLGKYSIQKHKHLALKGQAKQFQGTSCLKIHS